MESKYIALSIEDGNKLLQYLETKPFREVFNFINILTQAKPVEQKEDE